MYICYRCGEIQLKNDNTNLIISNTSLFQHF